MIANYHTHTYRCGHAEGNERDYAEQAVKAGLRTLGVSDHTPYDFFDIGPRNHPIRMALEEFPGTILAISHDRYFINRFATRVAVLEEGGVREYLGNYDDYFEKINRAQEPDGSGPQITRTQMDREKKRSREEQRKLNELKALQEKAEKDVMQAEKDAAEMEEQLQYPSIWQDPQKAQELSKAYQAKKAEIEHLYEVWESLT